MIDNDGMEHAGNLSFLGLLSIFPSLFLVVSIYSYFVEYLPIHFKIEEYLRSLLPELFIEGLLPNLTEIISAPPKKILSLAIIGAVWTASSFVEGLRTVLNKANGVSSPPNYISRRIMSIFQFLLIECVILLAILLSPILDDYIWQDLLRYLLTSFVSLISISWFYIMLTNVKQKIQDVIPGALLVLILWIMVTIVFSAYIKSFTNLDILYGSLAGIVTSLIFFYLMNLCFIYGAEFNFVFRNFFRSKV